MTHKYFHHDDFEITDKLTDINKAQIVEFTKKTRMVHTEWMTHFYVILEEVGT
jgi:hypothetical protein